MSKKKPTDQKPKQANLWVYFVSYTAMSTRGNFDGRREVKYEKGIRFINDINEIENRIRDSMGRTDVSTVMIRHYVFMRNESLPQTKEEEDKTVAET